MKRTIIQFLAAFAAVGLLAGCSDRLDKENPSAIPPSLVTGSEGNLEALMNSAYTRVNDFGFYGQEMLLEGDVMADVIDLHPTNRTGRYEGEWVNQFGVHMARWGRYTSINDANFVAKFAPLLDDRTEDAVKNRLRGEALFVRALSYFALANTYGFPPGQENAYGDYPQPGFNLAVPVRTEPTEGLSDAVFIPRSTNREVYNQIIADLQEAITLLPDDASTNAPHRASIAAAHALLARVYLYDQQWSNAATQAQMALDKTGAGLSTAASYEEDWQTIIHPESIFESFIADENWSSVDGVNNSLNSLTNNRLAGGQFILVASQELIDAHESDDVRLSLYEFVEDAGLTGRFQSLKWIGEKDAGQGLENVPIIRVAEMYLILAEARLNSGDVAGARTALNTLRTNRGLGDVNIADAELENAIIAERMVELAYEGHRYFDFLRRGLPIPKSAESGTAPVADGRLLAPLPNGQVRQSAGVLEQNPGY